jgi:hypothetical protein
MYHRQKLLDLRSYGFHPTDIDLSRIRSKTFNVHLDLRYQLSSKSAEQLRKGRNWTHERTDTHNTSESEKLSENKGGA